MRRRRFSCARPACSALLSKTLILIESLSRSGAAADRGPAPPEMAWRLRGSSGGAGDCDGSGRPELSGRSSTIVTEPGGERAWWKAHGYQAAPQLKPFANGCHMPEISIAANPGAIAVDLDRTALIVIDMQRDF